VSVAPICGLNYLNGYGATISEKVLSKRHKWQKDTPIFGDDRGRRDEERKQFAALMRELEAVRTCHIMTKVELATER
jgi:hypothetical protein